MNSQNPEKALARIESALRDIRAGKMIIVTDDEGRENEGDLIAAAEHVTAEMVNFMVTHGRGLVCAPLTAERCVSTVVTDLAVVDIDEDGFLLREVAPGVTVDEVKQVTGAPLRVASDIREMEFG